MSSIINYKIDILDIVTLFISIIALISSLRKREFGKLYFIPKESRKDIWLKVIKSDLYELEIIFEPYSNMNFKIKVYDNDKDEDSLISFQEEIKPIFKMAELKQNSIIKFINCNSRRIHIKYRDKYNNLYSQNLTQTKIDKRLHKNIWNITFSGN
ncbi:MAG: hypothetical protein ACOVQC_01925 [Flavobacterium sp.]